MPTTSGLLIFASIAFALSAACALDLQLARAPWRHAFKAFVATFGLALAAITAAALT
jgi:hypothetical protein